MDPRERARALVLEHGWNATSYQILNPGFLLWFNESGTAVIGYVEYHGVRVVAGVPICALDTMTSVAAEFETASAAAGFDVAYFAVESRAIAHLREDARASFVIGAQPVWQPLDIMRIFMSHRSLRAQINRALGKFMVIQEWDAARAENSPELRRCLAEWLAARKLPPLHFLVETDTLSNLLDRVVLVAILKQGYYEAFASPSRTRLVEGDRVVGFLIASPIPARNGWLVEQNVRGRDAPNGTTESLLFMAAAVAAERGGRMLTLGLSPLSKHAPLSEEPPPRLVRALFKWLRMHGRRFYNFEGLDTFKAKFKPEVWEPVYAVVPAGVSTWRALIAMGAAFGGRSAIPLVTGVLRHALGQELARVRHHAEKKRRGD